MLKFLASIKFAVGIMIAIAIASVVATMNPDADVYGSVGFRVLLVLFTLNLTLCTLKYLPNVWKSIKRTASDMGDEPNGYEEFSLEQVGEDGERVIDYLKSKGYKVTEVHGAETKKVLAKKGVLGVVAPQLLHIGILVILIGAFLSSFSNEGAIMAYPGQIAPIPAKVGEGHIKVLDFQTVYDEEGHIDNWVTDMQIIRDEQVVYEGETKVNYPIKYDKMTFYQNSYGYHHIINIQGEQAGDYSIPDSKHFGVAGVEFIIVHRDDGELVKVFSGDDVLAGKLMQPGDTIEIVPGTTLEYLALNPYTVLGVKYDAGTPIVFLGFIIATISSMLFWAGRYREVRLIVDRKGQAGFIKCICKSTVIGDEVMVQLREKLGR